ncbi:MAG: hypothetical protein ABL895_09865 [Cyclobacteriaceae bacterium]
MSRKLRIIIARRWTRTKLLIYQDLYPWHRETPLKLLGVSYATHQVECNKTWRWMLPRTILRVGRSGDGCYKTWRAMLVVVAGNAT